MNQPLTIPSTMAVHPTMSNAVVVSGSSAVNKELGGVDAATNDMVDEN